MSAANVTNLPVAAPSYDAAAIMESVLLAGDLSKLSPEERTNYYMSVCQSVGLNPLTRPFDYIKLSGREVLYAKRDAADQLRKLNRISLEITDRKMTGDLLIVTVRATTPDGRTDEDMGAVSVKGLQGEALANAMLKAMTKAKRRATLSICGLGMLDETEVRAVLDAEALAGPVLPHARPPARPIEARTEEVPARPAKGRAPIKVKVPGGWPAMEYRQDDGLEAALEEALLFMEGAIPDGGAVIVGMNNPLLDRIAEKLPQLAERVSMLRAAAAEALAAAAESDPDDEPDDDDFPGDRPSREG